MSPMDVIQQRNRPNTNLSTALEAQGVTRKGVISELARIATTGEKITTEYRNGKEVRRTVIHDPTIQLQAIERLEKLLDRAEGSGAVKRSLTYREE